MQNSIKSLLLIICLISSGNLFSQNQLVIPPLVSGPVFNLDVQADSTEFFPGHKTPTYGINGSLLAPTLEWNRGETVTLNVTNHLNTTTTMHWHGVHLPSMEDGGPYQVILQDSTWSPSFTVLNDAGTFWYHPHRMGFTDLQVSKGLAGMIIVRDTIEAALALPRTYGVDDFPIIIQSKCFDVLYQVAIATPMDTVPMVNGTIDPFLDAPAQVVRLRMLNGSSERSYMIGFSNNMAFNLIGTDGGLIQAPLSLTTLLISPGERAEILVDLSALQGQSVSLMNYGSLIPNGVIGAAIVGAGSQQILDYNLNPLNGADYSLLQINVVAPTVNPVTSIPSSLVTLNPWNAGSVNVNRAFTFAPQIMGPTSMVEGPFTINGNMYSMGVINDTVYLNNIEEWTLINQTMIAHPFHVHDVQFFVTDVNGNPPPAYLMGQKDVVLVGAQSAVTFITKFEDYADATIPYMYHCHLLHHEDDGMMGAFIVLDSSSTSIVEFKNSDGTLFPNPVDKSIIKIVSGSNDQGTYYVSDISGKQVLSGIVKAGEELEADISMLVPGTYIVHVIQNSQKSTYKFIRQ